MPPIRLVLFDIDGTLVSCGRSARRAFEEGLLALWPDCSPRDILNGIEFAGCTDRGILEAIFEKRGARYSLAAAEPFWPAYLPALENWLTLEPPVVHPGAPEAASRLRARGLAVGLLTGNHPEGARRKLAAADLHEDYSWGGFGELDSVRDALLPRALEAARLATGEQFLAAETLLIGDTPRDIACARAHGARVAVVPTGFHDAEQLRAHQPDFFWETLEAVVELKP